MEEKIRFRSSDGVELCGIWDESSGPDHIGSILLAHGITADKDELGNFVDVSGKLVNAGFSVFRFDFRGSGESGGKSVEMTIEGELRDLESAYAWVKHTSPVPVGILGASFGGGIAAMFVGRHTGVAKAVCLWNPVLNYEHAFLRPYLPEIRERTHQLLVDIRRQGWGKLGSRKYVVGKKLFDEMEVNTPYEYLKYIQVPLCIIHGDEDTHVPYDDSSMYVHDAWNGNLVTIHGAKHGFHEEPFRSRAVDETVAFFLRTFRE